MKRIILAWAVVVSCLVGGYLLTRHGQEIKQTHKVEMDEFAQKILRNAADGGSFDLPKKKAFLSYLGYPDAIKTESQIVQLVPAHPGKEKSYSYKVLVDGKVICESDRQTLEGYYMGREHQPK